MAERVLLSRPPAVLVHAGWERKGQGLELLLYNVPFYDTKE
jgi:hypothetical protein